MDQPDQQQGCLEQLVRQFIIKKLYTHWNLLYTANQTVRNSWLPRRACHLLKVSNLIQ